MTAYTTVMLDIVQWINKVHIIYRCGVTAHTTRMARYLARMILRRMGTEVTYHTGMTLVTGAGCGTSKFGPCVMTDITVVMLQVIHRAHKGSIIYSRGVTAYTTGS